jgi:chromosomal replication initiator protein
MSLEIVALSTGVDAPVDTVSLARSASLVNDGEELWTSAARLLREQVSDVVWLSTFQDVRAGGHDEDGLHLVVPSTTVREHITTRYLPLVEAALGEAGADGVVLVLHVTPPAPEHETLFDSVVDDATTWEITGRDGGDDPGTSGSRGPEPPSSNGAMRDDGGILRSRHAVTAAGLNPRYGFETFVKGQSNQFALAAAQRVAEVPARSYNPLFIYGAAGLGKTHLLHAIGHYVDQNYSNYEIRYVSTETFLNEYVDAIRNNATAQFKRRYREVDVLLIDDIQFMEGKEGLQEEFFHTFNSLHGANRQIVISSDRMPDAIPTLEDRLRGRFKWGLITDIQPPDLETRLAILRNKAERDHTAVPAEVLEFIAVRITNNIRELEGALIRVTAYASLNNSTITVSLAEQLLGELLHGSAERTVSSRAIIEAVADYYRQPVELLRGKSRQRPLVLARQVAMYVMRDLTDLSYPAIAREFGGRDHTTVIHAVSKVEKLMKERQQVYDQVTFLITQLKNGA